MEPNTTLPKVPKIRVYTALLTQDGTAIPTASVLQNTLGYDVEWTRSGVGLYFGELGGEIPDPEKTACLINQVDNITSKVECANDEGGFIKVRTIENDTPADGLLYQTMIEVRIYL